MLGSNSVDRSSRTRVCRWSRSSSSCSARSSSRPSSASSSSWCSGTTPSSTAASAREAGTGTGARGRGSGRWRPSRTFTSERRTTAAFGRATSSCSQMATPQLGRGRRRCDWSPVYDLLWRILYTVQSWSK